MVIERAIAVQPEDREDYLHPIAHHRRTAQKPTGDEPLDVLGQMGGQRGPKRVPGDLSIPDAMLRREA
jgi:hypothetical protein